MNDNQEIVLHWLKIRSMEYNPFGCVDDLLWQSRRQLLRLPVSEALFSLDDKEKFRVLQAFAEWGLTKED